MDAMETRKFARAGVETCRSPALAEQPDEHLRERALLLVLDEPRADAVAAGIVAPTGDDLAVARHRLALRRAEANHQLAARRELHGADQADAAFREIDDI